MAEGTASLSPADHLARQSFCKRCVCVPFFTNHRMWLPPIAMLYAMFGSGCLSEKIS
jgi:hypothetical protein